MEGLVSDHYRGERGRQYVSGRQDEVTLDHLGHRLQAHLYEPFLSSGDDLLDFGCANGSLARALAPHVRTVSGLEVNEHSRTLAASRGLEVFASLTDLPAARQFHKIVSNHVLEHIPNVAGTLQTLRRHLRPGGRLIVVLPIEDHRTARNRSWRPDDYDRHLYSWTPLLFGNLLDEAGFKPLQLEIINLAWSPKLFFLGDSPAQKVANWLLAGVLRRRQLLAVAEPAQGTCD
jgi:2-polyprenyl-3-methyl-5-hydroxy-6-metoxy-1,4-benzoquinol methylase